MCVWQMKECCPSNISRAVSGWIGGWGGGKSGVLCSGWFSFEKKNKQFAFFSLFFYFLNASLLSLFQVHTPPPPPPPPTSHISPSLVTQPEGSPLLVMLEEVMTMDRNALGHTLVRFYLAHGSIIPLLDCLTIREVHSTSESSPHPPPPPPQPSS